MAEFSYNNTKNASTSHTLFELNCKFYQQVLFEKNVNLYSKSCTPSKLAEKLREPKKFAVRTYL